MYALNPDGLYAHEGLRQNPDARTRLANLLTAMNRREADVRWYAPADAVQVSREIATWTPDRTAPDWKWRQPIVFSACQVNQTLAEDPVYQARPANEPLPMLPHILGHFAVAKQFHAPEVDAKSGMVCWPSMFLGSVGGCSHGCVYCGTGREGKALVMALNVRELLEGVIRPTIEANPQQKCFMVIGEGADHATLEPEYGLFADFLTLLAEYPDRYGYFHTNGDNVDWVEHVAHRDRLIGVWSLCSNEAAALLEPGAPPASERIAAMAKLDAWGVPFRVKFKPVLPIRDWQASYGALIDELLTTVKPETLGFCSLIWMSYDHLVSTFNPADLDPTFVAAAREAQEQMKGLSHGPFPHAKRAELYRFLATRARQHDAALPLFISTETTAMWDELAGVLGQHGRRFLCGCNPVQGPGPRFVRSTLKESNYRTNKEAVGATIAP